MCFQDIGKSWDNGIIVLCAFDRAMPHAFAEINKLVMEVKSLAYPLIDIYNSIIMPETIGSCRGFVHFVP